MTLLDRLTEYYGAPKTEQENFISEREKYLDDMAKNAIYQQLIETRSTRFGFPDVSVLAKYFQEYVLVKKETKRQYFWCVCDECKTEFAYSLMSCPNCYLQGRDSRGYKLKVSDEPPKPNVVRLNKPILRSGADVCINCDKRSGSYCEHFGQDWYFCDREDFDQCECKHCCLNEKKRNSELRKKKEG